MIMIMNELVQNGTVVGNLIILFDPNKIGPWIWV